MFGVIAGLRAATHETCLVLPVDTPLVTPELLRELVAAHAIPQTGPLPGVYAKAMLPELESRVARGELSLRGVNPAVLEVDEKLLLNVNTRMDSSLRPSPTGRASATTSAPCSSSGRRRAPTRRPIAGRTSTQSCSSTIRRGSSTTSWVGEFGTPVLTFLEPTAIGERVERRVLYEHGRTSTSRW